MREVTFKEYVRDTLRQGIAPESFQALGTAMYEVYNGNEENLIMEYILSRIIISSYEVFDYCKSAAKETTLSNAFIRLQEQDPNSILQDFYTIMSPELVQEVLTQRFGENKCDIDQNPLSSETKERIESVGFGIPKSYMEDRYQKLTDNYHTQLQKIQSNNTTK